MDDVLNAPETMIKVAMYNEEVDAAVGAEEAKRRFGDKIQIMASGDYWVDFVDVHSGKGNALQKLCNRLGITKREEVVAFGDNCNDVSMLLEAGKSYAVTTAREEAKQATECSTGETQAGQCAECVKDDFGVIREKKNKEMGVHSIL